MSWTRHQAKAIADTALSGDALHAALEDYVRVQNPHLTDLRLEHATATADYDADGRRWHDVTYLAQDPTANS